MLHTEVTLNFRERDNPNSTQTGKRQLQLVSQLDEESNGKRVTPGQGGKGETQGVERAQRKFSCLGRGSVEGSSISTVEGIAASGRKGSIPTGEKERATKSKGEEKLFPLFQKGKKI